MSLAVRGNLRVAAAARTSYGGALQLGYRTGTVTGMLTDGLGPAGRHGHLHGLRRARL
jgi:K(+)-stimulated pyrophosphate-energized sodium pump